MKKIGDFIGDGNEKVEEIGNAGGYSYRRLIKRLNILGYYYDEDEGKFKYTVVNPKSKRKNKANDYNDEQDRTLKDKIQELQQLYIENAAKCTRISELEDVINGKTSIKNIKPEIKEVQIKLCNKRIEQMKQKNKEADKKIADLEELLEYINNI